MYTRRVCLLLTAVLVACGPSRRQDDDQSLPPVSSEDATISITQPADSQSVTLDEAVVFKALAASEHSVESLTLLVGGRVLHDCSDADGKATPLRDCESSFVVRKYANEIDAGRLEFAARVLDGKGRYTRRSISVQVEGELFVRFAQPQTAAGGVAQVTGISPLEIGVTGTQPVLGVEVRAGERVLRTFVQRPFITQVAWESELGAGGHLLVARVIDSSGAEAMVELPIIVTRANPSPSPTPSPSPSPSLCTSDEQCAPGSRCCIDKGTCHPMVGAGDLCDCERPCPESQGCFPGTCGQTPRRCRPGCFPGSATVRSERCTPQDGRPAYCSNLPESERTVENKGGACAPADQCDIYAQNCPNLPIDRSRPAGPDNPAVPHSCVPVSPVANACYPAGPIMLNQTGCADLCGVDGVGGNCATGGLCVQSLNPTTGQPTGANYCAKMCSTPHQTNASAQCGGKRCLPLEGSGREPYPMGYCEKF